MIRYGTLSWERSNELSCTNAGDASADASAWDGADFGTAQQHVAETGRSQIQGTSVWSGTLHTRTGSADGSPRVKQHSPNAKGNGRAGDCKVSRKGETQRAVWKTVGPVDLGLNLGTLQMKKAAFAAPAAYPAVTALLLFKLPIRQ